MPRFRQSLAKRPIHAIKHIVDQQFGLSIGAQQNFDIIKAVDAPVLANVTEVETRSRVNAIYLTVECSATSSSALSNIYLAVFKNPGATLTIPVPNAIGASDDKRWVIHQEMALTERSTAGNPRNLFKGVIMFPRGYRSMANNDRITLAFLSPGTTQDVCFQCIYKEYR